jgi:undecaprenyl-diphosphatase
LETLKAVVLGATQGLTEFIPVSSSGHCSILQEILGFSEPPLFFALVLHFATTFAVCLFFRQECYQILKDVVQSTPIAIKKKDPRVFFEYPALQLLFLIIIGNIPTAVLGFGFKSSIERMFSSPTTTSVMLMTTGVLLWIGGIYSKRPARRSKLTILDAFLIGVAQGTALIPGISRSGVTLCTALALRLEKRLALLYSLLLSVPAVLGASLLEYIEKGGEIVERNWPRYCLGAAVSFAFGVVAIKILSHVLQKARLSIFGFYCFGVGLLFLYVNLFF